MKIKVKNLVANPYRNIEAYPIHQEKIRQLRNSIRETTFWDNILARPAPKNGKFEIAYGHHRLVAIKEELGEDTVVDIPVRDLSDEDMLRIMANENMQQWETNPKVIIETIRETRKFIRGHSKIDKELNEKCRLKPANYFHNLGTSKEVGKIWLFLGKTWNLDTINKAFSVLKADYLIIEKESPTLTHARIIARLPKEKVKQAIQDIKIKKMDANEASSYVTMLKDKKLAEHDKEILRENILEGRIRGKEQIREHVEFIKVRKLQEAKKNDEDKRKEDFKDFIEKRNQDTVRLNNGLEILVAQFKEYPETKKYLPREETIKLSRSLTMLFITIKELIDITKGMKKEERKELAD